MSKKLILIVGGIVILVGGIITFLYFHFKLDLTEIKESVVLINVYDENGNQYGSGSGVIAFESNIVLTNTHVISEAKSVEIITDDNRSLKVSGLLYSNEETDITILKLEEKSNIKPLRLNEKISVADRVYAIGSPLGIKNSVTEGILSGEFNDNQDKSDTLVVYQHTAPISQGNSGGALIDKNGKLVGINYAYLVNGQNLNLAIKIKDYVKAYEDNKNNSVIVIDSNNDIISSNNGISLFKEVCNISENCVKRYDNTSDFISFDEYKKLKDNVGYIARIEIDNTIYSQSEMDLRESSFDKWLRIYILKIDTDSKDYRKSFRETFEKKAIETNDTYYYLNFKTFFITDLNYYAYVEYHNISNIEEIIMLLNNLEG